MLELTNFLEELKLHNINPIGLTVLLRFSKPQIINYHHLIETELQHRIVLAGWPEFEKEEVDLQDFFKKVENVGMYYIYILIEESDFTKIKAIDQFRLINFKENRSIKGFSLDKIDFYMKTIIL